jgi:hypothetical protein
MPHVACEFRKNRARHIARITSMVRTGISKALDIVVNAQPKRLQQAII